MTSKPVASSGTGMVVGAVVNKPTQPQQPTPAPQQQGKSTGNYGVTGSSTTISAPSGNTGAQSQKMPPGMLNVNPNVIQQSNGTNATSKASGDNSQQHQDDMANNKEKTPMCLVNELARFNKIQHQYTLIDEQGPAHKKTFYVKLKLGQEEEYSASGPSIKKAQHAAAEIALKETKLKKPPPKHNKKPLDLGYCVGGTTFGTYIDDTAGSITPTVELNSLAMKRGTSAVYRPIDMPQRHQYPHSGPHYYGQGYNNMRYPSYPKFQRVFFVSLKVGQREFIGEGNTRQTARHDAAEKALRCLRALPDPPEEQKAPETTQVKTEPSDSEATKGGSVVGSEDDEMKSAISLVHEISLKRNMNVKFEVIRESGPPHMRTFLTTCSCGDIVVEAEGNSKKLSKKAAAEKMLEKLQGLAPLPPSAAKLKKVPPNKKKNRNLVKIQKTSPDYGVGINPISRLIQIQQAKKEKEPVYSLVTERGMARKREFVMQVEVGEHVCQGIGPNKKLAKRNAAEAMLQKLGYSRPSPQPSKPAIKSETTAAPDNKKVTFIDQENSSQTRQLVPGVLLMPAEHNRQQFTQQNNQHQPPRSYHEFANTQHTHHQMAAPQYNNAPMQNHGNSSHHYGNSMHGGMQQQHHHQQPRMVQQKYNPQAMATIANEFLETGRSPTAESVRQSMGGHGDAMTTHLRPKQQLQLLADVTGIQIQYTDFPKGNNKLEYLSLVSISTNPPQVCHGAGLDLDQSHDMAALTALRVISEMAMMEGMKGVPVGHHMMGQQPAGPAMAMNHGGGDAMHMKGGGKHHMKAMNR